MHYNPNYKIEYFELNESNKLFTEVLKNIDCVDIAKKNNFTETSQALLYLSSQMKHICDSILLLHITEYAIMILYRSIIEHTIKHYYIFIRFLIEKTDNVGKEYCKDCAHREMMEKMKVLAYPNALKQIRDMIPKHKETISNALEFGFTKMINYIDRWIIKTGLEDEFPKTIEQERIFYSVCSSFTHGGPEAMEMKIPKTYIQTKSAMHVVYAQLLTIQTFAKFDSKDKESLQEVYYKIMKLLDAFLRNWPSESDDNCST